MTKEELFKKYSINESHNLWNGADSWLSVELFRVMHNGRLPIETDISLKYITDFLDGTNDGVFMSEIMKIEYWGGLYITAKRMVYMFSDEILKEISLTPPNKTK